MSFNGAMRSIIAYGNKMERLERRKQAELNRMQKQSEKMQELEKASYEVNVYENYIENILSIHKDCHESFDWLEIVKKPAPLAPVLQIPEKIIEKESIAKKNYDNYKPNLIDKIFKLENKKRTKLLSLIDTAKIEDETEYTKLKVKYENEYKEKQKEYENQLEDYNDLIELAKEINKGELSAYSRLIEESDPFGEIKEVGSGIEFTIIDSIRARATLYVHDEKVIPKQTKSLLKSGKLSIKDTPIGKYNEMYQDYICSASIRVARDLFSILPLEEIILSAKGNCLNKSTGKLENVPLLSVLFIKTTFKSIDFSQIIPSDCMKNFRCNMEFKKSQGMSPTTELQF